MADNPAQVFDSSINVTDIIVKILVTSLMTAIILRLANRLTIRANISYKTAYVTSLVTNTVLVGISAITSMILNVVNINMSIAIIPTLLLAIPSNTIIYQHMIKYDADSCISYKSAFILSLALIGIVIAIVAIFVGIMVAFAFLRK